MAPPRRPVLPTRPYAPAVEAVPPPPPQVVDQIGDVVEARTLIYPAQDNSETTVRLSKPWKAVDVYLDVPNAVPLAALLAVCTIKVYAVSGQGARTLVATGRYRRLRQNTTPPGPVWVASARAGAQRYEVDASWSSPASMGNNNDNATITVVGSNLDTAAPREVGAILLEMNGMHDFSATGGGWNPNGANTVASEAEVLDATVLNDSGATLFFQLFDLPALPAGSVPVYSWAMPAGSLQLPGINYRVNTRLWFGVSTTAATFTASPSGFAQVVIR